MDVTEVARVAGRYRLGTRLGSGGFGTVYAAHDERLDRHVALKLIPAHGPAPERAQREALAAARLHHPGIVAVYDAGDDRDGRYLVSELVQGRTLDVGSPANLVLVDPGARWTVDPRQSASRSRNTPYAGRELPARVVATFLRGRPTVLDGKGQ